MSSTDTTMTGAAGAAPMPAVVVCPAPRGISDRQVVRVAPVAALFGGTGLPAVGTDVRPWEPVSTRIAGTAASQPSGVAVLDGHAHRTAQRTTSSTPGDLPPGDPLS